MLCCSLPQVEAISHAPNGEGVKNLLKDLRIKYIGEVGDDEGGVSRDFFTNFAFGMGASSPRRPLISYQDYHMVCASRG